MRSRYDVSILQSKTAANMIILIKDMDTVLFKLQKLLKSKDAYRAKTIYHARPDGYPKDQQWFPDYVYNLVKDGKLPGKSIGGVSPKRKPTDDDLVKHPHWKEAKTIRYDGKIFEYSVVGIACNNNAEVEFVAKGLAGMSDEIISQVFPEVQDVIMDLRKSQLPQEIPLIKDFTTVEARQSSLEKQIEDEFGGIQNRLPEIIDIALKKLLGKVA